MVEVTDEVRRAAAIIYQRFRDYDYAGWILDGTNAMGDADSVIQALARIYQCGKLEGARLAIEAISLIVHDQDRETVAALDPAKIVGEG